MTTLATAPARSDKRTAYIYLALNIAIGSVAFTFVKLALEQLSPMGLAAGRVVMSALTYTVIVLRQPWRRTPIKPQHRMRVLLIGFGGSALFHILFQWGQQRTTVAMASVVMATMPALTALGEVAFLGHRLHRHHVVGLALTTVGCAVIGLAGGSSGHATMWGALAIGGSTLVWAAVTVATRSIAHEYDSWWLNTPGTLLGAVVMVGIEWPHLHEFVALSMKGWLLVIWLGSASSAFVYFAVARAMTALSATTVMSLDSIVVPLSVMVGWVVLGTAPSLADTIGGIVVIGGVLLVVHERAPADELSVTPL